jgi:hypothetical protein
MFVQALPVEQSELVESANNLEVDGLEAEGKMYNNMTTWVAEIHQREQLKKAEIARRAGAVCLPQSKWSQRMGLALSEVLIASGEKLRERYDPGSCYETM